jgi:hypothetical protein
MPRNVYFSQTVKSEQNLYEDLIIESLKIYGQECYYLPRHMVSRDMVLNEAIESKFDDAYSIEMYLENVDGFEGDGSLMTKFGLEIRDQATFVVAKKTWEKLVGFWNNGIISTRPAEGDLIYLPLSKGLFEIKFVDHQQPFYQLSKFPVYKLRCELFEYSNEEIKTGIDAVDKVQQNSATEFVFKIGNSNDTQFVAGETVTQVLVPASQGVSALTMTAQVLRVEDIAVPGQLNLYLGLLSSSSGEYNEFQVTSGAVGKVIGADSGAQWDILQCYTIATADVDRTFVNNNQQAQNRAFELEANAIIDFSEHNPFGDPSLNQ